MDNRPQMPVAQIVYGEIVYWLCVVSALLCCLGPWLAMAFVDNNVLNPHYLFGAIWEGVAAPGVWALGGNEIHGGHFWIDNITKGDGLTQFGLVVGGSVALPALLGSAFCFLFGKPRQMLWTLLSLWVAFMITISCSGVVNLGH